MPNDIVTVTIIRSSHPDYEYFASFKLKGKQFAKRGSKAEVDQWVNDITKVAHDRFGTVFDIQDNS